MEPNGNGKGARIEGDSRPVPRKYRCICGAEWTELMAPNQPNPACVGCGSGVVTEVIEVKHPRKRNRRRRK